MLVSFDNLIFISQSECIVDVTGISADEDGALKVQDYMSEVKTLIQRKLNKNKKDLVLSIVTSAAEQLGKIPVHIFSVLSLRVIFSMFSSLREN